MQLRDYQLEISQRGVEIIKEHKLLYLAMQQRTGKTITSLTIAHLYGAKSVLFVTKLKAINSIKADYVSGGFKFNLIVTNYESLHKLSDSYDFVIIDEGHSLGSYPKPSLRTKRLKDVCKGNPIILMSGTPTPEGYSQIYHQLFISDYSPYKEYSNFYKWSKDYVNLKLKYVYGRTINDYSDAKEKEIKEDLKHLFITYSQEQAGFENKIQEEILTCKMNPALNEFRDKLKKDLVVQFSNGERNVVADTAVRLLQLEHQICSGTVIDYNGDSAILDYSKAIFILDYFKNKKIVIFYKFRAEFDLLKEIFKNHTTSPEEFQDSTDKIFLGQFQSAREGIRLDTADAIVFYNIDFSSLSYFQAKDRIQSLDRKKEALLYWVFSEGGIEKEIYKAVVKKKDYTLSYYLKHEKVDRKRFIRI